MDIDSDLDAGAIDVLDVISPNECALALRGDTASEHRQWFHFRVRGDAMKRRRFRIVNAGEATFPAAFEGYKACASYDGEYWFRVPSAFDGEQLVFDHAATQRETFYAYFAPYSLARHDRLLARAGRSHRASIVGLGDSVHGRGIALATFGVPREDRRTIWITARQHPGETMAEWFAEGLMARLLDRRDPLARALLERAVIHVVPNMNPDGGVLGNLRTNAAGRDLNRSWLEPDGETSPEVLAVREAMETTGVDLHLDVHGDERNPYVFAAGNEGNPSYSARIAALENSFADQLVSLDPDFQREYGYPREAPGEADLSTAANWVGERFDCLALTLEMPFKDAANHPRPRTGWSPSRAMGFGARVLEAVFASLDELRD